mgnify:CR=1 FL=1
MPGFRIPGSVDRDEAVRVVRRVRKRMPPRSQVAFVSSKTSKARERVMTKIEILNLEGCIDPKASNYKPYFIKSDPAACR